MVFEGKTLLIGWVYWRETNESADENDERHWEYRSQRD